MTEIKRYKSAIRIRIKQISILYFRRILSCASVPTSLYSTPVHPDMEDRMSPSFEFSIRNYQN